MVFACLIKDNFCSQTPHNTANTHTHYSNAHLHVEPYAPPSLQWILLLQMNESLLPLSHSKPSKKWCHQCYNQSIQKNQKNFKSYFAIAPKLRPLWNVRKKNIKTTIKWVYIRFEIKRSAILKEESENVKSSDRCSDDQWCLSNRKITTKHWDENNHSYILTGFEMGKWFMSDVSSRTSIKSSYRLCHGNSWYCWVIQIKWNVWESFPQSTPQIML